MSPSPISPAHMDWSSYYPAFAKPADKGHESTGTRSSTVASLIKDVEVADIGCGFGGLLVALAPLMPDTLLLGMLRWPSDPNFTDISKGWKFEPKSLSTSKNELKL